MTTTITPVLKTLGGRCPGFDEVLTPEALEFAGELVHTFRARVDLILEDRRKAQRRRDAGELPRFLADTEPVRSGDWKVAPPKSDLTDRRVEITGPVDRKMIVNALNSGASVFMADFEDSCAPTWANVIEGQANLMDAVRRTIRFEDRARGKVYELGPKTATLMVRPRGWHLVEAHATLDGRPVSASLFDFGLYFFHNARALVDAGSGPYFYLPKLQGHLEARLWNHVFLFAQERLGLPAGTIRATVLIETLPAAFEMDEILHELREHSAGLNCGRWDYIFSFIKTFRNDACRVLPDRAQVTMTQPFLRAYTQLAVRTCHRRGTHAIGGMAAQIPIKTDQEANRMALEKVLADKLREVTDGHDGTWVAHPGLVPVAKKVFDTHMPFPNQIDRRRDDVAVDALDLLRLPTGTRTEAGLRTNVNVCLLYLEAWLGGTGCVPLYHLMEDAATAEISRTQIWQWIRHGAALEDGRPVTVELFERILAEENAAIRQSLGAEPAATGRLDLARDLFARLCTAETCEEFLTLCAYEHLLTFAPEP